MGLERISSKDFRITPPDQIVQLLARMLFLSSICGIVLQPEDVQVVAWLLVAYCDYVKTATGGEEAQP